jgi:hypothetical protein
MVYKELTLESWNDMINILSHHSPIQIYTYYINISMLELYSDEVFLQFVESNDHFTCSNDTYDYINDRYKKLILNK